MKRFMITINKGKLTMNELNYARPDMIGRYVVLPFATLAGLTLNRWSLFEWLTSRTR